jgi:NAD(P)-dependent dehydrogenase (short-subunit alcohol dehydrogenase family)
MGRVIDPDNVNMEGAYSAWGAYGRAKLANFHFALGLQQQFEKWGPTVKSLVAHPGLSHTNLQVNTHQQGGAGRSAGFWKWMAAQMGMSSARGALSQLRAATDPAAKGGEFYGPLWGNNGPPVRKPILRRDIDEGIEKLWLVSERETGVTLDFAAALDSA